MCPTDYIGFTFRKIKLNNLPSGKNGRIEIFSENLLNIAPAFKNARCTWLKSNHGFVAPCEGETATIDAYVY